jgi:hypothetical protein
MAQTVARNRQDLERALSTITSELLNEKGYICFVDVFMKLGYLSKSDYENWRFKRVSPLERVLNLNLSRINFIMKTVRRNSVNGHLKPSMTVYKSWGKGKKTLLQFSKSGDPTIETAYATHFVQPKRTVAWTRPHHCGHMWELAVPHLPSRTIDFKGLARDQFYTSSWSFF